MNLTDNSELDPVILAHEADAAWSLMRHHENQATQARAEERRLRSELALERFRRNAFNEIQKIISFYRAGWFETGDPQTPEEVLERITDVIKLANQGVERTSEAQKKKAQAE